MHHRSSCEVMDETPWRAPKTPPQCSLQGCFEELLELVQTNADVVGGVAAGIGAMEVTSVVTQYGINTMRYTSVHTESIL